ncbi:MAG: SPOR domain-containing protein [Candidatus Hydrogenedentota bacterium]
MEFSPGQLVLAICTVLLLGLVCFLTGVVVGRYDDSYTNASLFMRDTTAQQEDEQIAQREEPAEGDSDEEDPMAGEGRQVSPRPLVEPPGSQTRPRVTDRSRAQRNGGNGEEEAGESPDPEDDPESTAEPSQADEEPDEESTAPGERPEPEEDEEAGEGSAFEPFSPTDELTAEAMLDEAAEGGPYTIQVISYTAGDRALAEDYAEGIEEETGHEPTLAVSEDGAYIRVLIGAFPDQETARAVMQQLRELEKFEESFVRRRPDAS